MSTMVAEPYVNHIPTMTGGVGYRHLHDFYTRHFVNSNPPDTSLTPISRTGRRVEIPLLAVVKFRGDKLYHEHIYWDQASVLVQVGLLDPNGLPVAGVETARKLLDETLPSNGLMER